MRRSTHSGEHGVTLIELIVATMMGTILILLGSQFFRGQNQHYQSQISLTELQQQVRASTDLMVREVRMAGYDPTNAGFHGILYDASKLKVQADVTGDGDVADTGEYVEYYRSNTGNAIIRTARMLVDSAGVTAVRLVSEPLIENVDSFTYVYKAADGTVVNTVANETQIRQVQLTVAAHTTSRTANYRRHGGYEVASQRALVIPRNLAF